MRHLSWDTSAHNRIKECALLLFLWDVLEVTLTTMIL